MPEYGPCAIHRDFWTINWLQDATRTELCWECLLHHLRDTLPKRRCITAFYHVAQLQIRIVLIFCGHMETMNL